MTYERALTHVTAFRWVQHFTPLLINAARPCRHAPGDRWFVDETYAKIAGRWVYLYRAIDQHGQVIDVLVSEKRDMAATRGFFTRALEHGPCPSEVTTDRAAAYPRVLDELLPAACHVTEQYATDEIVNPSRIDGLGVCSQKLEFKRWARHRLDLGRGLVSWSAHRAALGLPASSSM